MTVWLQIQRLKFGISEVGRTFFHFHFFRAACPNDYNITYGFSQDPILTWLPNLCTTSAWFEWYCFYSTHNCCYPGIEGWILPYLFLVYSTSPWQQLSANTKLTKAMKYLDGAPEFKDSKIGLSNLKQSSSRHGSFQGKIHKNIGGKLWGVFEG